jgi:hypothetical protein
MRHEDALTETMENLGAVIRIQSDVINDLLTLLMQHISAEEADALPCIKKINEAARLKAGLDGWEGQE